MEELKPLTRILEGTYSIDYLIGNTRDTGRGLGTKMLKAFIEKLWRDKPAAAELLVPVHIENKASWRALGKLSFNVLTRGELTPDNPADSQDHLLMHLLRPQGPFA